MNWLERARLEIGGNARNGTAVSAERSLLAAMAVPSGGLADISLAGDGDLPADADTCAPDAEELLYDFEERAAIMEVDGGLSREEAEKLAWAQVINGRYLH